MIMGEEGRWKEILGSKVWAGAWKCPYTYQTPILVVKRSPQSMQGGRRKRMVSRRIKLEIRVWRQSKILGGSVGWKF